MTFYDLPSNLGQEIRDFEGRIEDYRKGDLNPVAFKGIRVAHGIYEQRKPKTHMVRIRCASGGIAPGQLKAVGELARQYGSGEIHVTTRQEMQLHYVDLEDVITVYDRLAEIGLSSRGGGGNTIRNIMASHESGVDPDEVFDVQPYAMALTTRMIAEPDSWNLPRKFKIAFSNREQDTIRASITCLGFFARIRDGERGFKVYCAGGMGAKPMPGKVLFDFIPDTRVYHVARAMKLMFDKYGNRRRRNLARLKFLWDKLGEETFRAHFLKEYKALENRDDLALKLPDMANRADVSDGYLPEEPVDSGFPQWRARYAHAQSQPGLYRITVPLKLGDIRGEDAVKVAETMAHFGDNCLRFSVFQNMHFRNIPEAFLGNIYNLLTSIDSLSDNPAMFGTMVACTGADTCKLGICLPRGVTPEIQRTLLASGLDLEAIADVKLHISGCPNTCGCHHAADLGFFGKVQRVEKDMLPAYNIMVGAILEEGNTRFSRKAGEIAAKYVPEFVRDVMAAYLPAKADYGNFTAWVDGPGEEEIVRLSENYRDLPTKAENPDFFYDWGAEDVFTLLKGQKAECSAGMFDMIDVDAALIKSGLAKADEAESDKVRGEALYTALVAACRMLLVTRGIEPKNDEQILDNFLQHFIRTDLVPERYTDIVLIGKTGQGEGLIGHEQEIRDLGDHLKKLYKSMDDSLRFKTPAPAMARAEFLSSLPV